MHLPGSFDRLARRLCDVVLQREMRVMSRQVRLFDPNQPFEGHASTSPDHPGTLYLSRGENYSAREPRTPALESSAFTFITGILMSSSLVAAVGSLIKAIASAWG
jgi:hypothetical protein